MLSKNDFIENNLIPNNDNCKDISTKLKEFLQQNIPEALNSNGEPDLTKIKNLLGLNSLSGYELKFPGKGIANALYSATIYKELQNENPTNDIAENFIIEGDNLDALKILAKAYNNKIKMIYIDPPYNTGTDDFVYNDNFRSDFDSIAKGCGLIDANGEKTKILKEMESTFKGSKTHSAWLCFMYPRLKLARDLLKDDGVIFISIDDNEQANLKLLCDEIFGEENFVANIIWEKSYSPINLKKHFSNSHDFILCYAKNYNAVICNGLVRSSEANSRYSNPDNDFRGDYKQATLSVGPAIQENIYEIITPSGRKILPPSNYSWMFSKERYEEMLKDDRIYFGSKGDSVPTLKRFLSEVKNSITPMTIWKYKEVGHQQDAMRSLKTLFNDVVVFDYPKPITIIQRMLQLYTNPNDNDIILDFFAGSGTTAHAVMAQNLADNGNRKFILVQLDEAINEKKNKTSFDFCKNELQSPNPVISNITIERIKRAKKILNSPCNFDVYKIINEPEIDIENDFLGQRNQQNPLNLITNLLLKAGEEIGGKNIQCLIENKLYKVDTNYFVINFVANDEELFNILQADKNGKIFADMYINCDIESWLNFQSKFKERLTIL